MRNTNVDKKAVTLFLTILASLVTPHSVEADRSSRSLSGDWLFRHEGDGNRWKTVRIPATFEEHEGIDFDGIGLYKKQLPPFELPEGMRAIIHFQAAATMTDVTFNGSHVGSHLGGWTPFRVDVTELVRSAAKDEPHELTVRVDEKVGHNSQGFLPIFAPHFGGIWQEVKLLVVPECWIDDLRTLTVGDPGTGNLHLEIPIHGLEDNSEVEIELRFRLLGQDQWSAGYVSSAVPSAQPKNGNGTLRAHFGRDVRTASIDVPVPNWKSWSPGEPNLYEVDIRLRKGSRITPNAEDHVVRRAAFRSLAVDGPRLLLNGSPLIVRGLLNWGYAPPRVAPSIDERQMRDELRFAKSHGFNLMKFCLWVPPQRYLDMADEMGMLAWMEYPTWHSKWTPDQLPTLEREFTEFFAYDRNHPSIVLRSLTCETGPSADLNVIRTLYDRCHAMVPDAVVEDDSSWIGWNRIHDFYDDHPYGNNHTWIPTLDRLKHHIAQGESKPLVLGEAIAADTWVDRQELLDVVGDRRPFWLPRFFDGNLRWVERMREVAGEDALGTLAADSKHYALSMRKFQIEAYRREVPFGGYVVSVIRDIPLCSMGLLDYLGHPKWNAADWSWHCETMLLLETESDRRSFAGGDELQAKLMVSHFGEKPIKDGTLVLTIAAEAPAILETIARKKVSFAAGRLHTLEPLVLELPDVDRPTRFTIDAKLTAGDRIYSNQWPMWLMPSVSLSASPARLHASCSEDIKQSFGDAEPPEGEAQDAVIVASRLDNSLMRHLEAGGRVLLLPDGQKGSFPLSNEWFLRGGPCVVRHRLPDRIPRQLLVELQHFDLAGPVIPDITYLGEIDPFFLLWHNHDLDRVKSQGLVFESRVGRGRILVSALRHTQTTNSAGRWLAKVFLDHLASGPPPQHAFSSKTVDGMKAKIDEQRIDLTDKQWQFRPDPNDNGLNQEWHLPTAQLDDTWKPIRIGQAWEGLGYPTLDGWAWYRIQIDIPASWSGSPVYVSFEGADDYYELYVNGERVGSGGDIETKTTAFEERKSHDATSVITAGKTALLAVRIYDWHGAGGLFRPVTIGTVPIGSVSEVLK